AGAGGEESFTGEALKGVLEASRERVASRERQRPEKRRAKGGLRSLTLPARQIDVITVEGACQHNLKNVTVEIPREQMTVCCGPSGSGKSSLALDTIYAEGQRRYIESLSSYARQFLGQWKKPKGD